MSAWSQHSNQLGAETSTMHMNPWEPSGLLRSVDPSDFHVPDTSVEGVYNIGDMLNAPSLWGVWPSVNPKATTASRRRAASFPGSILDRYWRIVDDSGASASAAHPVVEALRRAVADCPAAPDPAIQALADDPGCAVVHVRSGDRGPVGQRFVGALKAHFRTFQTVILCSGVHGFTNERRGTPDLHCKHCAASLNTIIECLPSARVYLAPPDVHLKLFAAARHLMLHHGGFSVVAGLIARPDATVYCTAALASRDHQNWTSQVRGKLVGL